MKLIYNVKDKPSFGKVVIFALQQLLAILAATIAVPTIVQNGMSQSAALFGAGIGTLVYLLFTKFRSPVFLGSVFSFVIFVSRYFSELVFILFLHCSSPFLPLFLSFVIGKRRAAKNGNDGRQKRKRRTEKKKRRAERNESDRRQKTEETGRKR